MVKLEKVKSFLLICLIICSLFITSKIWFNNKLWPEGYNFFVSLKNNAFFESVINALPSWAKPASFSDKKNYDLYMAKKIIINSGTMRTAYSFNEQGFLEIYPFAKEIITKVLKANENLTISEIDENEWLSYLKAKSIFLDYKVPVSTSLYSQFLSINEPSIKEQIQSIFQINIVILDDSNNVIALFKDYETKKYQKVLLTFDKTDLIQKLDTLMATENKRYKFSFELNLDKKGQENKKIVLDPLVLIPLSLQSVQQIEGYTPIYFSNPKAFEAVFEKKLLKLFNYNSSGARKLTDKDGTTVFVENFSTLKILKQGILEYKAKEDNKGIVLKNISSNDFSVADKYEIISNATRLMRELFSLSMPDSENIEIRLSSPLIETKKGEFILTFDYYFKGLPVLFDETQINNSSFNNAVYMEIKNGYLVNYRQIFRGFRQKEETTLPLDVISALDEFYKNKIQDKKEIIVSDVFLSYKDELKSGEIAPSFFIVTADGFKSFVKQ